MKKGGFRYKSKTHTRKAHVVKTNRSNNKSQKRKSVKKSNNSFFNF